MKYFHVALADKEQERLVSLNSPLREIVRNSDEVRCHFKATQHVLVDHRPYEHSFIVDVPDNLDGLESSYEFELGGEEEVAMLPTIMVAIKPKDGFRYSRRLWVAKDYFLPLKAVVLDANGKVLEQVVFTDLKVENKPEEKRQRQPDLQAELSAKHSPLPEEPSGDADFELTELPAGFKKIFFSRRPLNKSEQPVDHLLLGDGFATVSVYMKKINSASDAENRLPEEYHTVGAINSLSRKISDSQLTVLGEVPLPTIKFIAENIKLTDSQP
jgi:sigma-E factor negative regulatory protein RseB